MAAPDAPSLADALRLVRQLPLRERAQLIARLAEELAADVPATVAPVTSPFALPVLTSGTWIDDLPLSREELYGDDERC
jgi:hypothetical protein